MLKTSTVKGGTPVVSVVFTTYNHEKYIAESIQSILDQDFSDFELIVVNDGSQDKTGQIIQSFKDPRIHYIYQQNQGPSSASNKGIEAAKTEWISLMSGDDVAPPNRLSAQMKFVADHPDVDFCFGKIKVIDDVGHLLNGHFLETFYNSQSHSPTPQEEEQAALFYSMFMHDNSLHAVTAMFKKSCWSHAKGFVLTSQQRQDHFLWLHFLKHFRIGFLEDILIHYRIRNNQENLSAGKYINSSILERFSFFETVLNDMKIPFFKWAFKNILLNPKFSTQLELEIEKAFVYTKHPQDEIKAIGLKKLFYLL